MNKLSTIIVAILLGAIATPLIWINQKDHSNSVPIVIPDGGGMENPRARVEWEQRMMADPATGLIPDGIRRKELAFAKTLPNDLSPAKSPDNAWTHRGPHNVGGRTRALAIDISNTNVILAGSVSGGIWRSSNGGTSWSKSFSPDSAQPALLQCVTCISQDKRVGKQNIWYAGTGELIGNSASLYSPVPFQSPYYLGDGVMKSIDSGKTWKPLISTAGGNPQTFSYNFQFVMNVATHPSDTQDVVFAATYAAVYKSVNGGVNWSAVKGGGSYYTDVAVSNAGVTYLALSSDGSSKGLWRSDNTTTWTLITPPGYPAVYDRTVIAIDPNNEKNVYFLSYSPGYGKATTDFLGSTEWISLWKYSYISGLGNDSTNSIWKDLTNSIPYDSSQFGNFVVQGSYDMIMAVKPGDSNTVFLGGTNLYRSTDAFSTSLNTVQVGGYGIGSSYPYYTVYPNHHPDMHGIAFLPSNPNTMIASCDGGIYKTGDCMSSNLTWASLNNGYITTQFYTIALDHGTAGSNVVFGGLQDWGTWFTNSTNFYKPWTHPSTGDGAHCAVSDGGGIYYFSRQKGVMVKTTLDTNGYVTAFRRMDPIGAKDYMFINPFILDPVDNNVLYLTEGKRLWRNNNLSSIPLDNGFDSISTGWFRYSDSLKYNPTGSDSSTFITAIAASVVPANRVYIGTCIKKLYRINNANTGDPLFTDITSTSFPASSYINCIAVDPRDANKVMVVFANYSVYSVYYSVNAGDSLPTWKKVAGNLEQISTGAGNGPSCRWATILPVPDGTVYLLGSTTGLYATDTLIDNNTVWVQQGASTIGNIVVSMIDARVSDGYVVVGTHGNGVFSANIKSKSDVNKVKEWSQVKLDVNLYPNPARDNINIGFYHLQPGYVTVTIFDEIGRVAANVASGNQAEGMLSFKYDINRLSQGIYYCSVEAGGEKKTKSFVVTK